MDFGFGESCIISKHSKYCVRYSSENTQQQFIFKIQGSLTGSFVDYLNPDRVATIRKQFPVINNENIYEALITILNNGSWVHQGNYFFCSASLNTEMMIAIIDSFRTSVRSISTSQEKNQSQYAREHITLMNEDFEHGRINVQYAGPEILIALKAAALRSQMSYANLLVATQ